MKNNTLFKLFYCSAFISLFLFACNSANNATNETEQADNSDTLAYTIETYCIESKLESKQPDSLHKKTYFEAQYPKFKDSTLNSYIQSLIVFNDNPDTNFNSIEAVGQAFINSYEEYRSEDFSSPWVWYSNINAHVVENNPSYISIAIDHDDFTGGAHGNHGTVFSNYNRHSQKEITLDEIIPASKTDSLTLLAKDIFMKQEGIDNKVKTFDNYFFKDDQFALNNNFLLQDSSILFLYNVYEIKPYSDGITKLEIPYDKIKNLFSEEAKEILKIK